MIPSEKVYNWQIALGNETLSPAEFEKLASLKVPLVKVRGQWVELKPEEIEKAIAFFKKRHGEGEMSLREALRLGLSGDTSETGLKVTGFSAQGWVGDIVNTLQDGVKIESLPTPETFHGELRPYHPDFALYAQNSHQMGFKNHRKIGVWLLYVQN
jgi:hypothetical protein